jgi:hypothetical protein
MASRQTSRTCTQKNVLTEQTREAVDSSVEVVELTYDQSSV